MNEQPVDSAVVGSLQVKILVLEGGCEWKDEDMHCTANERLTCGY
jgi:hypothetical protein